MVDSLLEDSGGEVALEEWISGSLLSVPLLELLGLDSLEYNPQRIREGDHEVHAYRGDVSGPRL